MKSHPIRTAAAAMVLVVLAGCGASGGNEASDTAEAKTTTTVDTFADDTDLEPLDTTTTEVGVPDGDALDEWASSFCGAFEDRWLAEIETLSASADDNVTPGDLESVKASFVGLFRGAADATATLVSDVEALGAPDTENGEEIHAEMVHLFGDMEGTLDGVADEMESLSTDDPEFQTKTMDLVDEFSAAADEVQGSFETIDAEYPSPELGLALSSHCSF